MKRYTKTGLALLLTLGLSPLVNAQELRIATWNIQYLNAEDRPERLSDVRNVINAIDADVIALQEIDDRAALEAVFDVNEWQLVIDDDSGYRQDLALAVRYPHRVVGSLEAQDDDFLFSFEDNTWFPNRRDILHVEIQTPGHDAYINVLVAHLKSRVGGRASNDYRRAGAAMRLVEAIRTRFVDQPVVLLGDFNDNPDDRALNILETGDINATIRIENEPGSFMQNLTEPLLLTGHVTSSINSMKIDPVSGALIARDMRSRTRNYDKRDTNAHTGNILFDQILTTPTMTRHYIDDSITVFAGPENIGASDHLPVYADFALAKSNPATLRIAELLPNPYGTDAGRERITLSNSSDIAVVIDDWKLVDRAGATLLVSGSVDAQSELEVAIPSNGYFSVLPLNNTGDTVWLVDASGDVVDKVSYSKNDVSEGSPVDFR